MTNKSKSTSKKGGQATANAKAPETNQAADWAKQMVEKVGGNLLGVVLNNINISQDSYYYYYSGYYYDYYSKQDDSEDTKKNGKRKNGEVKNGDVPKAPDRGTTVEIKQKY